MKPGPCRGEADRALDVKRAPVDIVAFSTAGMLKPNLSLSPQTERSRRMIPRIAVMSAEAINVTPATLQPAKTT